MSIGIYNNYNNYSRSYTNTIDSSKKTNESNTTTKTAADELSYLSNKYSNCSFVAANYTKGMQYGSSSTTNIAISPQFLSKMANDPELEKEYEGYIADMQILDEQNARSVEAGGWHIVAQGWAIDKDGGISKWSITQKDDKKSHLQIMSENLQKIQKQNTENKKAKAEVEQKRKESTRAVKNSIKAGTHFNRKV